MTDEAGTPTDTPQEPVATPDANTPPVETPPVATPQEAAPPQETPPEAPPTPAEGEAPPERVVPAADGYKFADGVPSDFGKFANSMDMTQEQAEGVLKAHNGMKQAELNMVRQAGEAHIKNWGEKAEYNMNLAKRAMTQHDPSGQLKEMLDTTGFGNHPVVLDFFLNLGQGLKEGGFLKTAINKPGEKTRAQRMYPNMQSETL